MQVSTVRYLVWSTSHFPTAHSSPSWQLRDTSIPTEPGFQGLDGPPDPGELAFNLAGPYFPVTAIATVPCLHLLELTQPGAISSDSRNRIHIVTIQILLWFRVNSLFLMAALPIEATVHYSRLGILAKSTPQCCSARDYEKANPLSLMIFRMLACCISRPNAHEYLMRKDAPCYRLSRGIRPSQMQECRPAAE